MGNEYLCTELTHLKDKQLKILALKKELQFGQDQPIRMDEKKEGT